MPNQLTQQDQAMTRHNTAHAQRKWRYRIARSVIGISCLLLTPIALALPSDFNDKLESALLCRSEWSTRFWRDYFNLHLKQPLRDWGEAEWWNAQDATLAGVQVSEVFLNKDQSKALMLGVLIPMPVAELKKKLEEQLRQRFQAVRTADGERYINASASVLVGLSNQQSKWYCARWNTGNREQVKASAPRPPGR